MIPFKLYQHEQQSVGVRTNPFYLRKLVDPCGDQIPPPIRQAVSMPPPPICPFVTGKAIYKGYRRRPFVPVYGWECKPHEEIFHPEKDYIVMGVSDYFNTKAEYGDPINLFSLKSKRCYNNMYKHIGKYLNYFSNFYDEDGELRAIYAHMKLLMDKYTDVLVSLQNPITKEPLYDAYGNVINGVGELGSIDNPIIAKTEEEMDKLNVSEFFGKFVKYVGPTTDKYVQNAYYVITEG